MATNNRRRRPLRWIAAGVAGLVGLPLVGIPFPASLSPAFDVAGFAAFVLCVGRALALWAVDDIVFAGRKTPPGKGPGRHYPFAAAAVLGMFWTASLLGQQTIFNIPSADVLDLGKVYVEEDNLWRPQEPHFALFTVRGVYGFGANIEAGANFGGFVTPGRSVPTATAAVKWQPLKAGNFSLTGGAQGLFFLRGSEDGDPSGFFYAHGAYAFSATSTRITVGGWAATAGYAAGDARGGVLVGLEQKIFAHLNLIADWFSGKNAIGYFTPGFSSTWGGWTIYAGYSFKNGDSKGNAFLSEIGFTF